MGLWEKLIGAFSGRGETEPEPAPASVGAGFSMPVEDVFRIAGVGVVVTGKIAAGTIRVGAAAELTSTDGRSRSVGVAKLEKFRKTLDSASAGENVGVVLTGDCEGAARGDVLHGGGL